MITRKENKRRIAKLFIAAVVILAVLALQCVAFAADSTTADTTIVCYGAKSVSMGRASTALSLGTASIFSNPAGTVTDTKWGITSMSTQLLHRVSYQMLAGTYNYGNATYGIGYVGASTPAGYYTTDSGSLASAQPISYGDTTLAMSCGYKVNDQFNNPRSIGDLTVGATLKLVNKGFSGTGVDGYSGSGYATDFGVILENNDGFALGATLTNILSSVSWASGYSEGLPAAFKFGGAKILLEDKLTISADSDISLSSYPLTMHIGAEYKPIPIISVRAGFDQAASTSGDNAGTTSTNLTAGIGINYKGVSFDYAYRQDSTLEDNMTHYFSISYSPEIEETTVVKTPVENKDVAELAEISGDAKDLSEPTKIAAKEPTKVASEIDSDLAELMELDR
ncbi:MAG: hypothetical protein KKB81_02425 [Candidatus Margulisbacteria bacterium]|nr:hypothetical protein [Candidatus Margulisiibacteriota bacterium]MBU1021047.1 hypothetical protein [Candidatus Margulisiibacteriota bacterium]MBU1729722.1 hypothetical protein [Candidatus Margulisiibacteriota bacterium]MBU1955987.1 hypothetical protein [Candidatus Margulisiibacteriota bacterium]